MSVVSLVASQCMPVVDVAYYLLLAAPTLVTLVLIGSGNGGGK